MSRPRIPITLVLAVILTSILATPAAARDPVTRPAPGAERPLTAAERAASERRIALAEAHARQFAASGQDLVPLACVTPQSSGPSTAQPISLACAPPQGFLAVEARDQLFFHYCGPAVGQVIANYTWAMPAGRNKYTQQQISSWMLTDRNGQTSAPFLEDGLEAATNRAPRRPAGWDWVVTDLRDRDGDGTTANELHSYIRSNISVSKMPMATPVKPHAAASAFNLPSWPKPVASAGHWVVVYGWLGNWVGGDSARAYYTDSSKDEGGATGKFWLPTRHLAGLIGEHTKRFVW